MYVIFPAIGSWVSKLQVIAHKLYHLTIAMSIQVGICDTDDGFAHTAWVQYRYLCWLWETRGVRGEHHIQGGGSQHQMRGGAVMCFSDKYGWSALLWWQIYSSSCWAPGCVCVLSHKRSAKAVVARRYTCLPHQVAAAQLILSYRVSCVEPKITYKTKTAQKKPHKTAKNKRWIIYCYVIGLVVASCSSNSYMRTYIDGTKFAKRTFA